MKTKHLPNYISMFRVFLVIPIIYSLLVEFYSLALILFIIAGISDGLDGFLAKRFDWTSQLGTFLDPLADKILLTSCYICLSILNLVPWWLTFVIVIRDFVLVAGSTYYYLLINPFKAKPSFISKVNTLLQILLVILIVFAEVLGITINFSWMFILVLITTLLSGFKYFKIWNKKTKQHFMASKVK